MDVMNATLLIIEDDEYTCSVLQEYFNRYFTTVVVAQTLEEASKKYQIYQPDILLSDIELEYEDTLNFISKIRKDKPRMCISLLSAHSNEEYLFKAIKLHIDEFIKKPINAQKLNNFIEQCRKKIKDSKVVLSQENNIFYCYKSKLLYKEDEEISLTNMEISFLELLLQYEGKLVSYSNIEHELYSDKHFNKEALRSLTSRMRKKLGLSLITSHSEMGYSIKTDTV